VIWIDVSWTENKWGFVPYARDMAVSVTTTGNDALKVHVIIGGGSSEFGCAETLN
jgi:hypothetical protein